MYSSKIATFSTFSTVLVLSYCPRLQKTQLMQKRFNKRHPLFIKEHFIQACFHFFFTLTSYEMKLTLSSNKDKGN